MRRGALLLVLGLGLALRLWGIQDRLPDPALGISALDDTAVEETDRTTMTIAWAMWGGGTRALDLNPHTGGWPALSFYATLALQVLFRAQYSLATGSFTPESFATYAQANIRDFFLWMRVCSVAIGLLSIYLTYRLAVRLIGNLALLAALLVCVNPLHIAASQHICDPNLLALAFVLLAATGMVSLCLTGRAADSLRAGVYVGFAGACKYVPLVLLLPLAYAHLRAPLGAHHRGRSVLKPNLVLSFLSAILAFSIATPFLLLDWRHVIVDVGGQARVLFSDWVGQWAGPIALPAYLLRILPHALGWPAWLLGVLGTSLMFRRGASAILLSLVPISLTLATGLLRSAQDRYVLPVIPFLLIGTSLAVGQCYRWAAASGRHRAILVGMVAAAMAAVVLTPVPQLLAVRKAFKLPDSRHMARAWINKSIPPSVPIAVDLYGPVFNSGREERLGLAWPFAASAESRVRFAYHPEWLDGICHYAVSSEVLRRFEAEERGYSIERCFYRWIQSHGRLVWDSANLPCSGPRIQVFALPPAISDRARRDSLWLDSSTPAPDRTRLIAWCNDLSTLFLYAGEYGRAEEWATRGLSVGEGAPVAQAAQLQGNLAYAQLQLGEAAEAEAAARLGLLRFPQNTRLHLYRGMSLEVLGRWSEALDEYRTAVRLDPFQAGAEEIRGAIRQLEVRMKKTVRGGSRAAR